jgi:hypothetical protein
LSFIAVVECHKQSPTSVDTWRVAAHVHVNGRVDDSLE